MTTRNMKPGNMVKIWNDGEIVIAEYLESTNKSYTIALFKVWYILLSNNECVDHKIGDERFMFAELIEKDFNISINDFIENYPEYQL